MVSTNNLFSSINIRGVYFPNRVVVPPMCQYSANEGYADDWHLVNLGRFAMGGAGLIITEATAVQKKGRITHGCLGIWKDEQIIGHSRIAQFISRNGSIPGIQLGHAGRKASMQRPWDGNGPLNEDDFERGDLPWKIVAASACSIGKGWQVPEELSEEQICELINDYISAARRSISAGYKVIELHGAHGYLIHSFLSPVSNKRSDKYGNNLSGRMRLAIEISSAIRSSIPDEIPLFFRVSSTDNIASGWSIEDSVKLASELKKVGVDVIDCSSGGISGSATAARGKRMPGYQVPFADKIKQDADIMTMAVGLITHPEQANQVIARGQADFVAIAREALFNPMWAAQAAQYLNQDKQFTLWPKQSSWWLERREKSSEFYNPELNSS